MQGSSLVCITFLLILKFAFVTSDDFKILKLDTWYHNLKSDGNLKTTLYRVLLDKTNPPPAIRIAVSSVNSTLKNALTVTAYHGLTKHIIGLPRVQEGQQLLYWFATDTLCEYDDSIEQMGQPVELAVSSHLPTTFDLIVKSVKDFRIGEEPITTRTSPSEPRFYEYSFPDNVDKVNVRITSTSELCGNLFVRRANCPLFDGSGLLEHSDIYFYQSFTTFGGFSLRKSDIGSKFHVAFTLGSDDSVCGTQSNTSDHGERTARIKEATISVTPDSELTIVTLLPGIVYAISVVFVFILFIFQYMWMRKQAKSNNEPGDREENQLDAAVIVDRAYLFKDPHMVVSHREYQKEQTVKDSKYFNFLFFQIFGSVLPALTTLFQNRQQVTKKGDLDYCSLNYLCSSDLLYLNSFNAMSSASSLAWIGVLNLVIEFLLIRATPNNRSNTGIHQQKASKVVCLLGLVAMGFLWPIVNNCPHKATLHLYVYTSLWVFYSACMWIYSKRHGVKRWQQYYVIASASAFGFITFVKNTFEIEVFGKSIINILFFITAMSSTGFFCFKYYYEKPAGLEAHQWIPSPFVEKEEHLLAGENAIYRPLKSKLAFVIVLMLYALTCFPVYSMCFILGKGHIAIYLIYYLIQKFRFERSSFSITFKITVASLAAAFFFFETVNRYFANYHNTFDVLSTPAKSREYNKECIFLGIDWNDVRQYNCALDCLIFIFLMAFIDSNLKNVPKNNIFVF